MSGKRPSANLSTFCVLPFSHLFANEVGDMHLCCMAVESNEAVKDETGKLYSFKNPSRIAEAWNSTYMKKTRLDLLSGRQPFACTRCFKFEGHQLNSLRQSMNDQYSNIIDDVVAATGADGEQAFNPYSVDIRLGNTCNLRCRMCSPQASKALIDEWSEIYPEVGEAYFDTMKNVDWFQNEAYWAVLLKHIDKIQNFHFAGGEPLLIKEMYEFLKKIIATGRSKEISISYNTNITLLPKAVFDLWPHFKSIQMTLSVDGTERINHYIRYPADWKKIISHLELLDESSQALNIRHLRINTTVQAYNIFDLPDFLNFTVPKFKSINYPQMSLLFNPDHLSVAVLPGPLKALAYDRLAQFHERARPMIERHKKYDQEATDLNNGIEGVLNYLRSTDLSDQFEKFKRVTQQFDRSRGQQLATLIPEFDPYLI